MNSTNFKDQQQEDPEETKRIEELKRHHQTERENRNQEREPKDKQDG